jgi:hypothetical protein
MVMQTFHIMKTPTCEIDANGNKHWFLNGKRHRVDGPACEWADGDKHWYLNGKCHRVDGPAYERANGDKAWYLNGKQYISNKSFQKDASLSDDDMIVLSLKYGPIST